MSNTKIIGINALIAIGIVSLGIISADLLDGNNYYCESRPDIGIVHCDNFSRYVSDNGKCIRNDNTNLICREGWSLVTDDRSLPDEEVLPQGEYINSTVGYGYKVFKCDIKGCVKA